MTENKPRDAQGTASRSIAVRVEGEQAQLPATQESRAMLGGMDIQALVQAAIAQNSPLEVLKELAALEEKMHTRQAREAFFRDFALFQAACPSPPKSSVAHGRKFDYNYTPIEIIEATLRPYLEKFGFSYKWEVSEQTETSITVVCILHHKEGHEESSSFKAPIDPEAYMNVIQQVGSSRSYAQRYTLISVTGKVPSGEDDDGKGADPEHAAGEHPESKPKRRAERGNVSFMPPCPKCHKLETVKRSKYNGPEFYCYAKLGGCGHKFDATATAASASEPTPPKEELDYPADVFDGKQPDPITPAQVKAVHAIISQLGMTDAEYRKGLKARYNVESSKDLTQAQATDLLGRLNKVFGEKLAEEELMSETAEEAAAIAAERDGQNI